MTITPNFEEDASFNLLDDEGLTDPCILEELDGEGRPVWTSVEDAGLFAGDAMGTLLDQGNPGSDDPSGSEVGDSIEDVEGKLTISRMVEMLSNFEGSIARARAEIPNGLESYNRRLLYSKLDQLEASMIGPTGVRGALFALKEEGYDLSDGGADLRANTPFMQTFATKMRDVAGVLQGHSEGAFYTNGRAMKGGFFHDFRWYKLKGEDRATPPMFVRRAFDHLFTGEGGFCSGLYPTFEGAMTDLSWRLPKMRPVDVEIPNAPYILTHRVQGFDPAQEGVVLAEDSPEEAEEGDAVLQPQMYMGVSGELRASTQASHEVIHRPSEAMATEEPSVAQAEISTPPTFRMVNPLESPKEAPIPGAYLLEVIQGESDREEAFRLVQERLDRKDQQQLGMVRALWGELALLDESRVDEQSVRVAVTALVSVLTKVGGVQFLKNVQAAELLQDFSSITGMSIRSLPFGEVMRVVRSLNTFVQGCAEESEDLAYVDSLRFERESRDFSRWAGAARRALVRKGIQFMSSDPARANLSNRLGGYILDRQSGENHLWWTDLMNALTHLRPVLDRAKVIRRCDADNHNMGSSDHPIVEHESLSSAQGPAIDPWYFPIVRPDQFPEPSVSVDDLIYLASDVDGIRPFGWREAFIERMAEARFEMAWAGVPGMQYFSTFTSCTGIPFEMLGAGTVPFDGRVPVLSDVNNLAPEEYVVNVSFAPEPSSCLLEKAALEAEVVVENSSVSASTQKRGRWAWFKRAAQRVAKAGMVAVAGLANTSGQAILSPISMASSPVSQTALFEEVMEEEVVVPEEAAPVEAAQPPSSVSDVSSDAALSLAPEDEQARATTLWTALGDGVVGDGLTVLAHHDRVQCALSQTEVEIPSKYLNSRGEFNRVMTILEGYYWERPAEIETAAQLQARAERDESLQPLWNEVKAFYMDLDEVEQAAQVANSETCNDAPIPLPSIEGPSNEMGSLMPMPTLIPGAQIPDSEPSLLGLQPGSRLKGMMKARMAVREKHLDRTIASSAPNEGPFVPMRPQDQGNVYGYVNRSRRRVRNVAPQQLAA